ncbi:serine/threonine protein phosphatase 2B catalytic subunit, putative [Entamoeba invadens IP1]|uniref:Serine/threonine-protein phosphatase n=1 Tax=Entamoeba invadens IP1 TaxID=370355 RepID=A0A0A1U236_ENTIV|nr:serine/threonine protein phosphatase 2B catalytic subunit, putative [Entamoeba invadens IP1]ELP88117.1 serine/threonine protein phosphatase 2B catalytic subunit, putative [Entamoeba invadens IP1]|eukprot:XP_004254888.1 serine/threonine protein phosphatase 2B catalytic subunit, putative [Entamoeba invadens IP1]
MLIVKNVILTLTPSGYITLEKLNSSMSTKTRLNELEFTIPSLPFNEESVLGLKEILNNDVLDIQQVIQHLSFGGGFTTEAITYVLRKVSLVMKQEPNVVEVTKNCVVLGDIHGQFFDLLNVLSTVSSDCFVFMGDYVDRGESSFEVFFLLCCLKLTFPNQFVLLRGNHETKLVSSQNQFKSECVTRYNEKVFEEFIHVFRTLPLCCLITSQHKKYLCVHGGISDKLPTVESINSINRFCEPERDSALEDLLWSDPLDDDDIFSVSKGDDTVTKHLPKVSELSSELQPLKMFFNSQSLKSVTSWFEATFVKNWDRGFGKKIGYKALKQFALRNNITTIFRGHSYVDEGYHEMNYMIEDTPLICTVFSAPNYMGEGDNTAAYCRIGDGKTMFHTFKTSTQNYVVHEFVLNFGETLLFEKMCITL